MTRTEAMQAKEMLVALRAMLYDVYTGKSELTPDVFRGMVVEIELLVKMIKRFE